MTIKSGSPLLTFKRNQRKTPKLITGGINRLDDAFWGQSVSSQKKIIEGSVGLVVYQIKGLYQ